MTKTGEDEAGWRITPRPRKSEKEGAEGMTDREARRLAHKLEALCKKAEELNLAIDKVEIPL